MSGKTRSRLYHHFCTTTIYQKATQDSSWGKKIMIVDDDIEIITVLPTLLKAWSFQITTLDDPRQFWIEFLIV